MTVSTDTPLPPQAAPEGPKRSDAPDAGEIEWAGRLIPTPLQVRKDDAARHFAQLRPPQMALGLVGLALLGVACA